MAKEGKSGVKVAIENQYDWTDHSHLGQALTYAAGVDAHIVIWVVPEFRNGHGEALNWLNNWTRNEIEFYGVEVSVTKTGESFDEPCFQKVVWPGGWLKRTDQDSASPRDRQLHNFFQRLTDDLRRTDFTYDEPPYRFFDSNDRSFPSQFGRDIGYSASFFQDHAWVSLNFRMESIEQAKQIFDTLKESQAEIEACLNADWDWRRHDGYTFSSINVKRLGSIDDPPEKLEETKAWMQEQLPKCKEIFDLRLEKTLGNMSSTDN